jgi:hypothetical protein
VAARGIASAAALTILGVAGYRVFAAAGFVALTAAAFTVFRGTLLGILSRATIHVGLTVLVDFAAAGHVFAVTTRHGFTGIGLSVLVFLMVAAGTSGFRRGSSWRCRGLLRHNRHPSGQRENCENCSDSSFHFFTL